MPNRIKKASFSVKFTDSRTALEAKQNACSDDTVSFRTKMADIEYVIGRGEVELTQSLRQKNPACPVSCSIDDQLSHIVSLRTNERHEPIMVIKSDDLSRSGKIISVGLKCESIQSTHARKSVSDRFNIALKQYVDSPDCSIDTLSLEKTRSYVSYAVQQPADLLVDGPEIK